MAKHITTTRRPKASQENLDVIIMAGVAGYRMKSYGPRCLLKLKKNETVLDRQISVIKSVHDKARFVVSTGFEAEKVIKHYGGKLSLIEHQYCYQHNESDEVRLAVNSSVADHVLIVGGHVLFNQECIRQIDLDNSGIIVDTKNHMSNNSVGVNHDEKTVSNLSHSFDNKWGYMLYLTHKELEIFRTIIQKEQYYRYFLFEIVNNIIDAGGSIKPYTSEDIQLCSIDSYADFLGIQKKEFNYV